MNRIDLYKKTVDILYQAYFNDTLEHGNCYACAVGNLIAANGNRKFITSHNSIKPLYWEGYKPYNVSWTDEDKDRGIAPNWLAAISGMGFYFNEDKLHSEIALTGYSLSEVTLIERAFESGKHHMTAEEKMFIGLCNVLEALKQIHEITDESLIEENHSRFADHHKKLTNATHRTV